MWGGQTVVALMVGLPNAFAECGGAEHLVCAENRQAVLLSYFDWILSNVYVCVPETRAAFSALVTATCSKDVMYVRILVCIARC